MKAERIITSANVEAFRKAVLESAKTASASPDKKQKDYGALLAAAAGMIEGIVLLEGSANLDELEGVLEKLEPDDMEQAQKVANEIARIADTLYLN